MGPWEEIFPFLIGVLIFMIPIIAILTGHQRKMAMIMRGHDEEGRLVGGPDIQQLRREVDELRQLIAQQAITMDTLASQQSEILGLVRLQGDLQDRVGG